MERFRFIPKEKIDQLPRHPGVYCFKNEGDLFYVGKALNLRERAKNHFLRSTYRDNLFIDQVKKIGFIQTDSEIDALILEADLIKKFQPKYNIIWKDDKNYFYAAITKEKLPRILITHQPRNAEALAIGPFVEGTALKRVLKLLRRPFPYYTARSHPAKACLWCHLNLCPGPNPEAKQYQKNIKKLITVLQGRKKSVLKNLQKEMALASLKEEFEKAARIRDQIESLENIFSHRGRGENYDNKRIEAYDVSNIQGKEATASMITFVNGQPDKNFYRRFKIRISGKPNDTAMLKEALLRRLNHPEWPYPNLLLIDGGKAQLNIAFKAKSQNPNTQKIKTMALAKKHNELFIEGRRKPVLLAALPSETAHLILRLRDEAHRFALAYHHHLRQKGLIGK